ncbi:MAG: hypothetical protein KGJ57_10150 [Sphingomonadales bacterium]|nr:hypothetical protein [Sphingomonadales bacterium]MDE2169774.1 hypothetical protein [Sphingomonadales bacterium]
MLTLASGLSLMQAGALMASADPARQACISDVHRLCKAEMQTMSRSKVRACLIVHMAETSPPCHDFMVRARAAALSGQKMDPSAR